MVDHYFHEENIRYFKTENYRKIYSISRTTRLPIMYHKFYSNSKRNLWYVARSTLKMKLECANYTVISTVNIFIWITGLSAGGIAGTAIGATAAVGLVGIAAVLYLRFLRGNTLMSSSNEQLVELQPQTIQGNLNPGILVDTGGVCIDE